MRTIQVNDALISAAKVYRKVYFPADIKESEIEANRKFVEQGEPDFHAASNWFLYQLADALIQTEKTEE